MAAYDRAAAQGYYGEKKYGEFYEEEKKWVEEEVPPPPYPQEATLLEFDAGAATANRYYVDGATLSVGADGVVRYVVVIKTRGGATNVSFEGIRCSTRERKTYAFGKNDKTWAQATSKSWQAISRGSYQAVLSREYFCPNNGIVAKAAEGVDALKRGGHAEAR
jgi:hypothetical protein